MRAIVQNDYGTPDVLELKEVPTPSANAGEVLVRVRAASVHAGDFFMLRGVPYVARFAAGWPKPKDYIPGYDVSGVVEAVGEGVATLREGDEVFGECGGGGCAEYVTASAEHFVRRPERLSFEQAAAVPVSALAALHGIRDAAGVQAGQHVLVNGASGGVGTYAIQIAKVLGAEVTGVCSTKNVELVRSIGADHVVDYTRQDFTTTGPYDVILDNVANRSFSECRRALGPDGVVVPNSGHSGIGYIIAAGIRSIFMRQQGRPYLSTPNQEDLVYLKDLIDAERLRPVIDSTFPFERTAEAIAHVGEGHASGKVIITF